MGTDIHIVYEKRLPDGSYEQVKFPEERDAYGDRIDAPLDYRSYGLFGFLANVRNYSSVPKFPRSHEGEPPDISENLKGCFEDGGDFYYSTHWANVSDLVLHNYDEIFIDKRHADQLTMLRNFLGDQFFADLGRMVEAGVDRIVFAFDC